MVDSYPYASYPEPDRPLARFALSGLAVAVLMVVFGILILLMPGLAEILIGVFLLVAGLLYLVSTLEGARYRAGPPGPPPQHRGPPIP